MKIIDENAFGADEGMILTNGGTFVTEVYIGRNDSIDNWQEITEEEAKRLQEPTLSKEVTE